MFSPSGQQGFSGHLKSLREQVGGFKACADLVVVPE